MELPITITQKAKEKITAIINQKNISNQYALRIGSKGSGCNQNLYVGFDTIKPNDEVFYQDKFCIIIQKTQMMYIVNVTLDYQQDEKTNEEGFIFYFA